MLWLVPAPAWYTSTTNWSRCWPASTSSAAGDDGVGQARLEPPGFLVGQGGGPLDPDHGVHEGGQRPEAGDREVLDGTQRLDAVERVGGDGLLAEGIFFDASRHVGLRVIGNRFTGESEGIR